MSYDPNSTDAMFGKVMTRLDQQDSTLSTILGEVKGVRKEHGERIARLETAGAVTRGKIALISALVTGFLGVAGWAVETLIKK